jgi:hypothetical protein
MIHVAVCVGSVIWCCVDVGRVCGLWSQVPLWAEMAKRQSEVAVETKVL